MIVWYRDVFEAEIVNRDPALAFLTYDDEHHRFAIANLDLLKPVTGGVALIQRVQASPLVDVRRVTEGSGRVFIVSPCRQRRS